MQMRQIVTCLYCSNTNDGPFPDAEHVLPKSFGKFDNRMEI